MGVLMKPAVSFVLLAAVGLLLPGCGSAMRDYLERPTPQQETAVRQDLTMPPDLRLPPPGTTAPAPDSGAKASMAMAEPAPAPAPANVSPVTQGGAVTASGDIYDQAGISRTKPDGTKKSDAELQQELRQYYLAKKRQSNPNYGTVFNIGNIFNDQ